MTMEAWAHCPNCSDDYPKSRDVRVRVGPEETHSGVMMDCPDCWELGRLSVGSPTLDNRSDDAFDVSQLAGNVGFYSDADTDIYGKPSWGWCVYVLQCTWKPVGHNYEDWKLAAARAHKRVYVGSTDDLDRRLNEHNNLGEVFDGSEFTKHFPVDRIMEIEFVPKKSRARSLEVEKARHLKRKHTDWFVWQS